MAARIRHNGHEYLEGLSPSVQPAVLRVTCKFQYNKEPRDVKLTKSEVEGLASVYMRLYSLPDVTRNRIREWLRSNLRLAESWRLDFFNTREQDRQLGIVPRLPGVPVAALTHGRRIGDSGEDVSSPLMRSTGTATRGGQETPSGRPRTPRTSRAPDTPPTLRNGQETESDSDVTANSVGCEREEPQLNSPKGFSQKTSDPGSNVEANTPGGNSLERGAAQDDHRNNTPTICNSTKRPVQTVMTQKEHIHGEFEAARDAVKDAFIWFQEAGLTLDDNDPLKKKLNEMSWKTAKYLERASKGVKASRDLLDEGSEVSQEEFDNRVRKRRALVKGG